MTMAKIAVTIPRPLLEKARRAVKSGRARSVSAYVAAALDEKTKLDELKAMLDEMLEGAGGPMTAEERGKAERVLGIAPRRRRGSAA